MINEDLLELKQLSRKTNTCKTLKPDVFCFITEYDYPFDKTFQIQLQCQGRLFFILPITVTLNKCEKKTLYATQLPTLQLFKDEETVQRRFSARIHPHL